MGSVPLPPVVTAVVTGLLLGLALAASPASGEVPDALRVVTFNLLHGGPASGLTGDETHLDERLRLVTRELRELAPDIVGLQESSITGDRNVAARLAADLGLHWAYASATGRVTRIGVLDRLIVWAMNFEAGPAVLSRWPIVETEIIDLPRCAKFYDPRVVLRAVVATPRGRLEVFCTHLTHDACQARRLGEVVRMNHAGPLPALVLGDFNASESTAWLQELVREAGLVDAYRTVNPGTDGDTVWQRPGAPEATVTRRVDFIFLRPGTRPVRVRSSRVILSTPGRLANGATLWPSDHYGVVADVALDGREARR